ncbi:ATP-dependent Clp protease proteolytic subunit [Cryptosporangium aurantiacum]|uniref:ATP-dependent Clp protease proteolytic subunit n=1 Tax=Cryptosporangium aurantiacum TaxID=134849 RepID=A0A1M7HIP2_9ACTN|nr:ATP-dependent Clp protease proteolytic subunit [Cryptosporangium aurantiacum]SHM28183.1 ATP-dependent Clp protease, protease subunit [Cryptosporangium aurantiacum]
MSSATWFPPERPRPWEPRQPEWRPPGWQPTQPTQPHEPPQPERPRPYWPPTPPPQLPPPAEDVRELWEDRLLDQRIVQVNGRIDNDVATRVASRLLLLESRTSRPVTLRLNSGNADLTAVWTLVDTLDALVVPVHALVVGELGGGSLALLTAVAERYAHPHARFRLADPSLPSITGTAGQLAGEAAANKTLVDSFHARLAELTGKTLDEVADDFRRGRFLTADGAVEYGLITDIRPRTVRPE